MPERARFRLVFESIDVGALFYDPAGQILEANRIAWEMLGLPLDPGSPLPTLRDVFPRLQIRGSDGRTVPLEELPSQRALRSGAPVAATLLQSPDAHGQLRWINAAAFPMVDEADRVTEVFLTLYDVTERRRLEEQVVQGQKMEAIGTLAGGIAHDFNNLLTIVTGYAELLRDRLIDDPDAVSDADALLQAAKSGATLTRQILAFSRKQVLLPVVIELGEFLEHLKPILRRLLGEDISLLLVRTQPSVRIKVDRSQLEQIVLNLAANARDAMRTGGQLTIRVAVTTLARRTLRFSYEIPPGRYAVLSATDTGIGMDAATQARVFEPFFTTKPPGRGTGLGLSTVYGIVKQSQGFVSVESEPGRGATFEILFPLVTDAVTAEAPTVDAGVRGGSETVLLVEDDEGVRVFACQLLRARGYTVLAAAGAAEADAAQRAHPGTIHLLLTDVIMPQQSGPSIAAAVRKQRPAIRVLYMSGYSEEAIAHHGRLDSDARFISKPFTGEALLRALRESLDPP